MKVEQIDTSALETKLSMSTFGDHNGEAIARTILWVRLANLAALAHELIVAELKDRA